MSSAEEVCCTYLKKILANMVNGSIETQSADPDLFVEEAPKTFQKTTFVVIGALIVKNDITLKGP